MFKVVYYMLWEIKIIASLPRILIPRMRHIANREELKCKNTWKRQVTINPNPVQVAKILQKAESSQELHFSSYLQMRLGDQFFSSRI